MEPNKLIYYRSVHADAELISENDLKRMEKVWGKPKDGRPYNHAEMLEEDHNYGTGLHIVTELMATMQTDRRLNERMNSLFARVQKGLTRSKSYGVTYVEENLLFQLIIDTKAQFVKDGGSMTEDDDEPTPGGYPKISRKAVPFKEFMRIFGIPYKSVMDEVKKSEDNIGIIPKPKQIHKINYTVGYSGQCSAYKLYHVKGSLSYPYRYDKKAREIQKKFPFLGKLHQSMFHDDGDSIQVYLYDEEGRDWGLQNVIDFLIKEDAITLK